MATNLAQRKDGVWMRVAAESHGELCGYRWDGNAYPMRVDRSDVVARCLVSAEPWEIPAELTTRKYSE